MISRCFSKAEVIGSNPIGCANDFNGLCKTADHQMCDESPQSHFARQFGEVYHFDEVDHRSVRMPER